MNFVLKELDKVALRPVDKSEINDRSNGDLKNQTPDELKEENDIWHAFFQSGVESWFNHIKDLTFSSTFCTLLPSEARRIMKYRDDLQTLLGKLHHEDTSANQIADATAELYSNAVQDLEPLRERLDLAIYSETVLSPVGKAFVKLSTRSPKDSKKALERAHEAYLERLAISSADGVVSDNSKWRILCEETTKAGAVCDATAALEMLLDSSRVYEDLEYALRGPPGRPKAQLDSPEELHTLEWRMHLVARAWDPRLKPESEFRGICWGGKLTCLCQYFHSLLFDELVSKKSQIEHDILKTFAEPQVAAAVAALGGHCIIDFAWLAPGEVVIVELNPFDGLALGVFPASTGLFIWNDLVDKAIMRGEAPFEFRVRDSEMPTHALKASCNPDWRSIIYPEKEFNPR